MKSITECYIEIARIEQQLKDDRRYLDERLPWLESQLAGGGLFKMARERPAELAGVRELQKLWPRHEKLLKARIFQVQSEVDSQKTQP